MAIKSAATRTYLRRFVPTMVIYVVLTMGVTTLVNTTGVTGPALWLLAALPAIPLIAVFWIIGAYLSDIEDEFIRLLEIRKALIATGFALSLASLWGFLEVYAGAPHIPLFYVPVFWFAGLGVGSVVNAIVERDR